MTTSRVLPVHPPATPALTAATTNGGGSGKTNLRRTTNKLKCDVEFESITSTSSDSDCESSTSTTLEIVAAHRQLHLETTAGGGDDGVASGGGGGIVDRHAEANHDEEDGTTETRMMIHPRHLDENEEGAVSPRSVSGGGGVRVDGRGRGCDYCDILLFDLDGTLYGGDVSTALNAYTQDRILDYLVRTTRNCPKFEAIKTREQAYAAWRPLILRYNQTVRGLLMDGYDVDVEECNRAIRSGSERFLRRDDRLREVLTSLPQRKMIFTNAPESTAWTYLKAIGIGDCFERIFGMDFMGTECCKPEVEAFEKVLSSIGVDPTDPSAVGRICFFEDNRRNLLRGKEMGMRTVLVARRSHEDQPSGPAGGSSERMDDDDDADAAGLTSSSASSSSSVAAASILASQEKGDGAMNNDVVGRGRRGDDLNEPFDFVIEDIGRDLGSSMPCLWS